MVMFMYYPLQIPSILDCDFIKKVEYKEYQESSLKKYMMCIWSMRSYETLIEPVNNVILPDGCIDILIDFTNKQIYFTGNSKVTLNFPLQGNIDFMGIRIKPGVFYNIFQFDCSKVMDHLIPYNEIEKVYHLETIFEANGYDERVSILENYLKEKVSEITIDSFVTIINTISEKEDIKFVNEVASYFGYSKRHLNRIFKKQCGVSLKVFLNIIRLHNCLKLIVNNESQKLISLAHESGFYDEAHFIKEIKKYCGISPKDLVKRYHMS